MSSFLFFIIWSQPTGQPEPIQFRLDIVWATPLEEVNESFIFKDTRVES